MASFFLILLNVHVTRRLHCVTSDYLSLRAFDHICMEKARYKFLIIIIIIIIIIYPNVSLLLLLWLLLFYLLC